jgi:hypothetical protein
MQLILVIYQKNFPPASELWGYPQMDIRRAPEHEVAMTRLNANKKGKPVWRLGYDC